MKDTFHLEDRNEYRTDIFSYGKVNIGNRANQGWSNLRIRSLIREFRGNLVRTRFARRIAIFKVFRKAFPQRIESTKKNREWNKVESLFSTGNVGMRGHRADTIGLLSSDWLVVECFSRGVEIRNENWFPTIATTI